MSPDQQAHVGGFVKKRMTPIRAGFSVGAVAGVALALFVLFMGVNGVSDGLSTFVDSFTAFLIGAVIAGIVAAFIQSRRLRSASGDAPPPGWYDSPEEDETQWYWSGSSWTDRTRPAPQRVRRIESGS